MTKNLIPIITKELGVEIGEEFSLKGYKEERFKFDNILLLRYDRESKIWRGVSCEVLGGLICGRYEVEKLPFAPKYGEAYWTYDDSCEVAKTKWYNELDDYKNKKLGLVFRTKEEALMERPELYGQLTGKEWTK